MAQIDEIFKWFTTADLNKYEDKYISIVEKKAGQKLFP